MKTFRIILVCLFFILAAKNSEAQRGYYPFEKTCKGKSCIEFREIEPAFFTDKKFTAVGEGIAKRGKSMESHYPMTPKIRRKILRKARRDKNVDKNKLLIIYVDDDQYYNSNPKQLYYCWGHES